VSLTSLIKANRDFRMAVKTHTERPRLEKNGLTLSEPGSKRHGLLGTAFDYLVGYTLEHLNPEATQPRGTLIAERALAILSAQARSTTDREHVQSARRALAHCVNQANTYIETGKLTPEFVASIIQIAQLDQIYRAGIIPRLPLGRASKANVDDIMRLYDRMPIEALTAKREVFVAPDFGMMSNLVGGADADFVIDGRLLDTKTSVDPAISLEMWCQVVGYYLLNRMESANGGRRIEVHSLGFYFARYGKIIEVDAEKSITDSDYLTEVMLSPERAFQKNP